MHFVAMFFQGWLATWKSADVQSNPGHTLCLIKECCMRLQIQSQSTVKGFICISKRYSNFQEPENKKQVLNMYMPMQET